MGGHTIGEPNGRTIFIRDIAVPCVAVTESRVPQQARGEERRERILRATLAVIGHSGIGAVTHRRVAEEAGVPLGSLTYWFATKDDLLREALRRFVAEEAERLRTVSEALESGAADPAAAAAQFAAIVENSSGPEQIAQFELYLEAARNPALRDIAAESFRAYEDVAVAALRAVGVADPEAAAPLFVSLSDGLGLRRQAAGSAPPLDELLLALLEVVGGAPSR
jgi:TetR/AcrR family transcriptional regulator, regulator of biofilm formation and stress response